uniref:Uncharacterized protein n=1 Tax=Arundo donax TaxID=35708 RepID=A0A0A9B8R8_ARUDO
MLLRIFTALKSETRTFV